MEEEQKRGKKGKLHIELQINHVDIAVVHNSKKCDEYTHLHIIYKQNKKQTK